MHGSNPASRASTWKTAFAFPEEPDTPKPTEVRLSISIADHDLEVKARMARRIMKSKEVVKVTVVMRGREVTHADLAQGVLTRFSDMLLADFKVERAPKVEGRNVTMLLRAK